MADIDDLLARYNRPVDSPQSDLADITSRYSGSGWDRDMVLPFAREVGGQQVSADPQAWRDSADIMRHIDQREGKSWKLASPQIAYDALEAAINVGNAPFAGGYRMDDDTRHKMIDMAGAIVGPQAGVGMARAAMGTGAGLGSHGGRLPGKVDAHDAWKRISDIDARLGGEHGRAIDEWVGGGHDARARGIEGGLMMPERLEKLPAAQLDELARPVRDILREHYGDTIPVYRGISEGGPSTGRQGALNSYTTDRAVAERFAGATTPELPLIGDAEIAAAQSMLDKTGEASLAGRTYKKSGDYIDIYDRNGHLITDTDSLASEIKSINNWRAEKNAERAKALARVEELQLPVDNIAWATDRFGQKELIARPPQASSANVLASDVQSPQPVNVYKKVGRAIDEAYPPRSIDPLGYYSQAYEAAKALPQSKGTPEQMLAMLRKNGAKDAELTAARINDILEGKPSVTRDEILKHLDENRIGLNEVGYGPPHNADAIRSRIDEIHREVEGLPRPVSEHPRYRELETEFDKLNALVEPRAQPKWANYSLDPTNPTYRETVLHLPGANISAAEIERMQHLQKKVQMLNGKRELLAPSEAAHLNDFEQRFAINQKQFQSGHFSEPNIIGHMMTSTTSHQGKPVYTVDQIQSDWGQRLRDKGVKDEGKIADLNTRIRELSDKLVADKHLQEISTSAKELMQAAYPDGVIPAEQIGSGRASLHLPSRKASNEWEGIAALAKDSTMPPDLRERASELRLARQSADSMYEPTLNMLRAELRTAEAATPGHPLVNSTDQWTNTTLRRALTQAANSNAEYLAIPTGDTVLSYNPGDRNGMVGFYGSKAYAPEDIAAAKKHYADLRAAGKAAKADELEAKLAAELGVKAEGIVPKNLRKILQKLDKEYPAPQYVPTLDSPSGKTGLGKGFSLFPLPEHIKDKIKSEGLPLFARGIGPQPLRPYEDE